MFIALCSPASARPVDVYVSARRSLKIQHVLGLKKTLCNIEGALSCSRRLLLLTALSATGTLYRQARPGHCISLDASTMAAAQQVMLTRQLQAQGVLKSTSVAAAFAKVDRGAFLAPNMPDADRIAYQDIPLPIGFGQTISAPHMHATCLELLEPRLKPVKTLCNWRYPLEITSKEICERGSAIKRGFAEVLTCGQTIWTTEPARALTKIDSYSQALDVGSGSGFLSAVMALLVEPGGRVTGVEQVPALAERSLQSIQTTQPQLLSSGAVTILAGNALSNILASNAEFDAIHVGAAAAAMPESLVAKLAKGGRMVIPVGSTSSGQVLHQVDKAADGSYTTQELMSVRYVPLVPPPL